VGADRDAAQREHFVVSRVEEPVQVVCVEDRVAQRHWNESVISFQASTLSEPEGAETVIAASVPERQNSYRSTSSRTVFPVTGSGALSAWYVTRTAGPAVRVTSLADPSRKHGVLAASRATSSVWADATVSGCGRLLSSSRTALNLSVNVTVRDPSVRAQPSGTFMLYSPVGGVYATNAWLSGMSPGGVTSPPWLPPALGAAAHGTVAVDDAVVVAATVVVVGAGEAAAGACGEDEVAECPDEHALATSNPPSTAATLPRTTR
jgi:hypothetical protein